MTREQAIEDGWRRTNTNVAEAVRTLAVQAPGDSFLREFLPHHQEYVIEGMRLTVDRCRDAITFLQAVADHLETHCPTCGQARREAE